MIALVSMNSPEYQEIADITWHKNKVPYCERHGFYAYARVIEAYAKIGFEKFKMAQFVFNHKIKGERIDWVWATGCDSLVTDFTNDLSGVINTNKSFIVATDINGINADSFFVKNDVTGRFIVERALELESVYDTEQHVIDDLIIEYPSMFQIVPQRVLNSYNYDIYGTPEELRKDKLGTHGQWRYGDLLIHWPGFNANPEMRVAWAQEWLGKIKYE